MGSGKKQPSSIDRLPEALREAIAQLRRDGRTVDEITDHVRQLGGDVSRSAVGRHVKSLAEVGESMRKSQAMAQFVVEKFGAANDDRVGRASIALLQGAIMEILVERPTDEDGAPVTISAAEAKELSLSIQRLISAQRMDAERQLQLERETRERVAREASQKLDAAAASGEIVADAVAQAKRIMGWG